METRCLGCMEKFPGELKVCPHCGYVVGTKAEEPIHMDPGTLLYDRYIIGKVLGYGGFGVTYIAWDNKLEQPVAIKEYMPGEFSTRMPGRTQITILGGAKEEQFRNGLDKFVDEAKRLSKFPSEDGIVRIIDTFKENDTAYLVMEYLDGMTLKEYIQENGIIPEDQAVEMLMPIMKSLEVVHAEGLIHRDIAPDNIFITKDGKVKLIDFGASRYATTTHSRSLTVLVKPGYSPEEQYRSRGDQGPYTDVYALAATMYKMMTGTTPPDALDRRAIYESKNKDIVVPMHKLNKHISRNRENAILNGMNVKIEDRTPDVASFISELEADPPVKRRYGTIKKIDVYSWPLWLKIVVPVVMVALISGGVFLAVNGIKSLFEGGVTVTEGYVKVPSIIEDTEDEAEKKLSKKNLTPELAASTESDYVDPGKIYYQSPDAETEVEEGAIVQYRISMVSDEEAVKVNEDGSIDISDFRGRTAEDATELLEGKGLKVAIKEEYDDVVEAGVVISQDKTGEGVAKKGDTVTLTVSKGAKPFSMPDVSGMELDEARSLLGEKGLTISTSSKKDNTVKENCVISQDPEAGASVSKGDEVNLVISTGKSTVTVAKISSGSDGNTAVSKLESQGFNVKTVEEYSSDVASGKVTRIVPEPGTEQESGSDITVYISKGKQTVNVKFDTNGGKITQGESSKTVEYGSAYGTLPTVTKSGYTFSGWYADNGSAEITSKSDVTYSEDHTLTAKWTEGEYKVSFDTDGGNAVSVMGVTYGKQYGNLPTPTKEGYDFKGWYTSDGKAVTSSTSVSSASDHTLYAKWEANTYTVRFDGNGSTSGSMSDMTMTYDKAQNLTSNSYEKAGYAFAGWKDDDGKSYKDKQSVNNLVTTLGGSITLKAQWTANTYTIRFDGNGSTSGSMGAMSMTYGETKNLTANSFSKAGYTFADWKGDDGKSYTDKQSVSNLTTAAKGTVTLKAQWTINTYKVSWNDGTGYTITVSRTSSPNGGASLGKLSNGSTVYYGDVLSITYTKADYYTIISKGKTSITVTGNVTSSDIYASAQYNSESDWVLESQVPSGAKITATKYKYTHRYYKDSSSSSLSGYTLLSKEITGYGSTKGPVTNPPSDSKKTAETQTVYKYYHCYGTIQGGAKGWGSYSQNPGATSENIHTYETTTPLSYKRTSAGNDWYGSYTCSKCGASNMWISDGSYQKNTGKYYYQEPVYTYHFYQDKSEESQTKPSGSEYSNIQTWVKYREK